MQWQSRETAFWVEGKTEVKNDLLEKIESSMDWSFPSSSAVKNLLPYMRGKRSKFDPRVGKIPWKRAWQPTPVFLPEKYHRQRSLAGYSPWGHKEMDMTGASEHAYKTLFMWQCVHTTYICTYKYINMWVTKSWTRFSN